MKTVLFLCTGNYYRSRFAELLFNHLVMQRDLAWQAISRGLALELGVNNLGPISKFALMGLAARGVALDAEVRSPLALDDSDLLSAQHIVAVNRAEHLPMLEQRFPHCVKQIEFWDVHDLDMASANNALRQLEQEVMQLIDRLHRLGTRSGRVEG
jgi:protein-tyrosine phosphatase